MPTTKILSDSILDQSFLKEYFHYDEYTGVFTRIKMLYGVKIGDVAGCKTHNGYIEIKINGKSYGAHRLAWLYMTGDWPINHIDHINSNGTDNHWKNLRDVTRTVNLQNQRKPQAHNKTSGLLGVHFEKESGKFKAQIKHEGKKKNLGRYSTAAEAYAVYLSFKRKNHEGCTI